MLNDEIILLKLIGSNFLSLNRFKMLMKLTNSPVKDKYVLVPWKTTIISSHFPVVLLNKASEKCRHMFQLVSLLVICTPTDNVILLQKLYLLNVHILQNQSFKNSFNLSITNH